MAIIAKDKGGMDFTPAPEGNHLARCYSMIRVGTVVSDYGKGPVKEDKVIIFFELCNELVSFKENEPEIPFSIFKEYTLSTNEKSTLCKDLEGWRGKAFTPEQRDAFDITAVLGKHCLIMINHETKTPGKTRAKIKSIAKVIKGMPIPEPFNPILEFNVEEFDQAKFDKLPDWIKKKIQSSDEYQALSRNISNPATASGASASNVIQAAGSQEEEDDLPF